MHTNTIRMKEKAYKEKIVEIELTVEDLTVHQSLLSEFEIETYVPLNSKNTSKITHKTLGTRTL